MTDSYAGTIASQMQGGMPQWAPQMQAQAPQPTGILRSFLGRNQELAAQTEQVANAAEEIIARLIGPTPAQIGGYENQAGKVSVDNFANTLQDNNRRLDHALTRIASTLKLLGESV